MINRGSLVRGRLVDAARDARPVGGLTHNFYRYPARFSPQFVSAAIEEFSQPGQIVLDPYMGGATTIVEAMVAGRRAIGSDINQLAVFIAQTKVSILSTDEERLVKDWINRIHCNSKCNALAISHESFAPKNMSLPQVRWIRKVISLLLTSIERDLPEGPAQRFARCVLLNVGQWALNGRKSIPSVMEFRWQLIKTAFRMIDGMVGLRNASSGIDSPIHTPIIRENDTEYLDLDPEIAAVGGVDLVVTSPPYPGIHMLYHRWQVDGRKETNAPYWITGCSDGAGASFYNFADRRSKGLERYFEKAGRSFSAVRRVMRKGAVLVQMVAFSDPRKQIIKYLDMMEASGFSEMRAKGERRIWRSVPGRRWHANTKGSLPSSREVVLLHEAV